jgi:hypothetical protein
MCHLPLVTVVEDLRRYRMYKRAWGNECSKMKYWCFLCSNPHPAGFAPSRQDCRYSKVCPQLAQYHSLTLYTNCTHQIHGRPQEEGLEILQDSQGVRLADYFGPSRHAWRCFPEYRKLKTCFSRGRYSLFETARWLESRSVKFCSLDTPT